MKLLVHDLTTGTTSHHSTIESAMRTAGYLLSIGHNVRMERGDVPAGNDVGPRPQIDSKED